VSSKDGRVLHAIRCADRLTAADAVAWFGPATPPHWRVVGYAFTARAATWLRVHADGVVEAVPGSGSPLPEAYELVLFDGDRELRWLQEPDGRGAAVALGEDRATLPDGIDVTADPAPRRGDTHQRMLAGIPRAHPDPEWATLASERYTAAHLPWAFTTGDVLMIETVEYLTEDGHGNVDVADTRIVGLRTTTRAALRTHPSDSRGSSA
jgi:hypothetical protein